MFFTAVKPIVSNQREDLSSLEYGDELRLTMKDQTKRVVTVLAARESGARVKELFHGIYDLNFDDVMFVHVGEDIYPPSWLRKRGQAHMQRMC